MEADASRTSGLIDLIKMVSDIDGQDVDGLIKRSQRLRELSV